MGMNALVGHLLRLFGASGGGSTRFEQDEGAEGTPILCIVLLEGQNRAFDERNVVERF